MTVARPELEPEAALAYCREARRLRHRLKHAPVRLHRSLRSLQPAAAKPAAFGPNDVFAELVAAALEKGTLRYSRRLQLLRQADRLGIERFEANLIIAMVQHQLGKLPAESANDHPLGIRPWMVMAAVQASIVLAGWLLWMKLA